MKILLAGLALASICSVNSYGPPPSKTKHRTTTTTISPIPDVGSQVGNSIYSTGPDVNQQNPCGSPTGGCGVQSQFPSGQSGQPPIGPYSPSSSAASSASSGGATYWWQGPNSPFSSGKIPSSAQGQPQQPGSNQPGYVYPGSNQPGSTQPGQPGTGSAPESKPIDISKNPFLSSALGVNKPTSCGGTSSGGCGGQPSYPSGQTGQPHYPSGQGQTPFPAAPPGQPQYPSGSQGQPSYQGGASNQPGSPHPGANQPGQPQTGSAPEAKPIDISKNPFFSSGLGINNPGSQGQPQYPGSSQVQPQYPGGTPSQPGSSPQYPGGTPSQPGSSPQYPGGTPSQPGSSPQYPGGTPSQPGSSPQYPGGTPSQPGSSPQYPGGTPSQPGSTPQYIGVTPSLPGSSPQYPGGTPSQPGSSPQYPEGTPSQPGSSSQYPGSPQGQPQYPVSSAGQPQQPGLPQGGQPSYPGLRPPQQPGIATGQPQYPSYGSGSNNIPGSSQFPPPFPGVSSPFGQSCNAPNHLCVTKSACYQGVLTQNGVPGRAGICNSATEVCCKIPTTPAQGSQSPTNVGYGNGAKPGTNGIPIGGSIYDKKPVFGTTPAPTQPYTGPLNTTPHPGCPAALKCVPISLCTAEGVMTNTPVYLTREQEESRVPLTDCVNTDTNAVGKCCRDPNYKDPWPAGMMMGKTPTAPGDYDDGQYHPSEQETSNTFSHEAGIYYNVVSTTPKGHTVKKPIGNFNQKPSPFPTVPSVPVSPGREPAPVHENTLPDHGDTSGTLNTPSNEILPPQQGQPNIGYNQVVSGTTSSGKPSVTVLPYQPGQPGSPAAGYQPGQSTPGQTGSPASGYQPGQSTPGQPGSPTSGYQPGQSTPGQPGSPTSGYQPGQSIPTSPGSAITGYQPSQSTPGQPGSPATGYQPGYSTPGQPGSSGTGFQPGYSTPTLPGSPSTGYQPGLSTSGQPGSQSFPSGQPGYTPSSPGSSQYPTGEENYSTPSVTTYTPRGHQAGQPSTGFAPGQIAPGSSCGIRHQAFSNNPEEAGVTEFPWQAIVTSAADKKLLCGAAIISENAVITAAHCIENFRAKDLVVKVGVWKLFSPSDAEQIRPVVAIARHPKYDSGSLAEDLAILVVSLSFTPTEHVDKICLPKSTGYRPQSNNCVVTGWGHQALKGPIPNSVLHKVDIFFMDNAKCEQTLKATHLGKYFILNKGFSCALPKSNSDLCKVDVGGPLACDRGDGHYELAGVNSWDVGCPAEQTPTVFTNPDAEWIQNIINTPVNKLQEDEDKYNADKLKGESLDQVDIDQKPGFALGYGK